ncbi:MAG: hypothetical protein F6K19_14615 [Cyanothece sp. SIO1E1]|nr:hypothetical protein [Cyanothece sp. SIO1E1]
MDLLELARAELLRSNADRKHPFRLMYLSTTGEYPETRTVVKRKATPDFSITFFTDSRSPKVSQIRANPKSSVLFYHPKKKLQIRLYGQAHLIDEGHGDFDRYLQSVKESPSLKDYTTLHAPGDPLTAGPEASVLFGDDIHFIAIEVKPEKLDILLLGRENHTRSLYVERKGEWHQQPLVP